MYVQKVRGTRVLGLRVGEELPRRLVLVLGLDEQRSCPPGRASYRIQREGAVRPAPNGRFALHMMPN